MSVLPDESQIQRLQAIQERRAKLEAEEAQRASDSDERHTHERRAEKAAYLLDKLADQAESPDA